ncbi:MAG TPA: YbfB/YjiJ family MFS transporter [Hyphomicrobiales bacterium]|nr:YbfB/YjiJ family MFS transporter [Hyphomicrobiales bacterium]
MILLGGFLAQMACMGLGRFFYTPMLPLMQEDMGFSDAVGGWIAGANFLGYLVGALWVTVLKTARSRWWMNAGGLVLCVVGTFLSGAFEDESAWAAVRFLTGVGSALAMVLSMALVLENVEERHRTRASGFLVSGVGGGIALSGLLTLILKSYLSWQALWFVGGGLCLVMAIPAIVWTPRHQASRPEKGERTATAWWINTPYLLLTVAYFLEGAGYSVSATFLVDLLQNAGSASWLGDGAWIAVGLAAAPSAWLWGRAASRFGGHRALVIAYCFLTLGVVVPVYSTQPVFAFLAAIMFGGTFLGIVGMSLAVGTQMVPQAEAKAQALAVLTIAFGAGQIIGPVFGGETAIAYGGYQGALLLAGAVCAGGLVFTVLSQIAYRRQGIPA